MASPHATPPREPPPAEPLVAAIEEAASFLAALWNRETEDLPTSATQLHVLLIVERHRDINLSGLASQLGALVSSASRLCDRLEAAGLLHRLHGSSRRAVILRLSPEGRGLLDRLGRQGREGPARGLTRMPPVARAALATGLSQFRAAAAKNAFAPVAPGLSGPA